MSSAQIDKFPRRRHQRVYFKVKDNKGWFCVSGSMKRHVRISAGRFVSTDIFIRAIAKAWLRTVQTYTGVLEAQGETN